MLTFVYFRSPALPQVPDFHGAVGLQADVGRTGHEVRVGAGHAVLGDVQALDLLFRGDPQADGLVDEFEHQEHHEHRIGRDRYDSQRLHAQVGSAAAVEQAAFRVEQAVGQRAPKSVRAMDGDRAHGVVDVELEVHYFYYHIH